MGPCERGRARRLDRRGRSPYRPSSSRRKTKARTHGIPAHDPEKRTNRMGNKANAAYRQSRSTPTRTPRTGTTTPTARLPRGRNARAIANARHQATQRRTDRSAEGEECQGTYCLPGDNMSPKRTARIDPPNIGKADKKIYSRRGLGRHREDTKNRITTAR